jgi:hypothetical protein
MKFEGVATSGGGGGGSMTTHFFSPESDSSRAMIKKHKPKSLKIAYFQWFFIVKNESVSLREHQARDESD